MYRWLDVILLSEKGPAEDESEAWGSQAREKALKTALRVQKGFASFVFGFGRTTSRDEGDPHSGIRNREGKFTKNELCSLIMPFSHMCCLHCFNTRFTEIIMQIRYLCKCTYTWYLLEVVCMVQYFILKTSFGVERILSFLSFNHYLRIKL